MKRTVRKWLSLLGIISILSSLMIFAPVASAYTGADAPSWASEAVDSACERGLIDCTLEPKFTESLNRAAGYQMLTMGYGVHSESASSPFDDASGMWFEAAAHTAYTLGWTVGVNGNFDGAGGFSRAQIAVATAAILGLEPVDGALDAYTDDGDVPSWATDAMSAMVDAGLIGQGGNTTLRPNASVSKVEAITILNSAVTYGEDNEVDVLEVAADRLGTDVDTVQQALDEGLNVVDGELVGVEETPPEGGEETPPVTGTASVAIASDTTPGTILATLTAYNPVLKFNVSAGSDADVKLNGLTVTRGGYSANTMVSGVSVYDESGMRHGNVGTSWNDNNTMDLDFTSDPITVTKSTTETVTLKVNLAGIAGGTLTLSLAVAEAVKSDATLSGTFPIISNTFDVKDGTSTVGSITVDAVQVHNNGTTDATAVNINLGTTRQHIATFRVATGANEAVHLSSMKLYNNGSAADGDVTNITLVGPDGADVQVVEKTANKYLEFTNLNYALGKSVSSKDFKVYGDVMNGSTRTFRLLLQNDYDMTVTGDTSLAQLLPTAAGTNDTAFPIGDRSGANFINMITVSAGSLSFSRASDSPTGNIAAGATSAVFGRWELKATGEDMEIRQFSYVMQQSAATNLAGTLYFKVHEDGTTNYTTLYSVAGASADYTNNATAYTTTFVTLKSGKTYWLEATGDVLSTAAAGLTYTAGPVDITQVKRVSTNDIVDPAVGPATANTLTVQTGTLTVIADSSATAPSVVVGQSTATALGTWNFTAGSGEGISITSVIIDDLVVSDIGGNFKELELWIDGAKRSIDTSATLNPAAAATTVTFNVQPSYTIGASQTAVVVVKGKVLTNATRSGSTATLQVAASGISGNGVTSQTALSTIPAAAVNGQTITISAAGTLTVSRDTVTNVKSSQIVTGSTGVTFGAFKLQTGDIEDVRIKKITLRNIGSNTNGLQNMGVYDGTTLLNDNTATTANEGVLKASLGADTSVIGNDPKSVTFDYTASPYVIPKNTYKVLTVKANTIYSATSGQTVQFTVAEVEAEGTGSNGRIYVTQTTELTDTGAAAAWSAGQVFATGNGNAGGAFTATCAGTDPCNGIGVTTTAVAAAATLVGANAPLQGVTFNATAATQNRLTRMNTVMNGSSIVSEAYTATAAYSYAVGDVVALVDAGTVANTNVAVVTNAVAVGADMAAMVTGITLVATDRVTRLHGGFSETTLASAETAYNLGDILAVTDVNAPANNGLYTVTNAIAVGGDMTAAGTVASQVVQTASGAALVTGDYVAKMPTQHTEVPSAAATYAYNAGDVIVVDDDGTAANNGVYVVRTAVAVGGSLLAADALGTGITFVAADRISKLYVQSQEDNLKTLYPTKLNFAWVAPASTTLPTGNQVEVGRFTMGSDAANANNPGTSVSVSALNFTQISSARLTAYLINDVTNNANITSNSAYANTSSFSSSATGGAMSAQSFQQGETRTFKILADVGTNAGSQTVQFRFNGGTQFTAGTATWTVGAQSSTWTVLAADAADVSSTTLTSSATGSDTTAPTISTILITSAGGADDTPDASDTILFTFAEEIDPASINTGLVYAGSVTAITSGTGVVTATTAVVVTVAGITTFDGGSSITGAITGSTVTLALDAVGTGLTVTLTAVTGGSVITTPVLGAGTTVAGTVRDIAGNLMAAAASPVPTQAGGGAAF